MGLVSKILTLSLLILSACSFGALDEGDVVERSKERPPDWIGNNGSWIDSESYQTVFKNSKIPDLPLGAKDSQLEAMVQSEKNLRKRIAETVKAQADKAQINIVNKTALDDVITNEVNTLHSKYATIKDIYFEKIMILNDDGSASEFYNIFVKASYPTSRVYDAYKRIGMALQRTSSADLQTLGALLNKDAASGLVGH